MFPFLTSWPIVPPDLRSHIECWFSIWHVEHCLLYKCIIVCFERFCCENHKRMEQIAHGYLCGKTLLSLLIKWHSRARCSRNTTSAVSLIKIIAHSEFLFSLTVKVFIYCRSPACSTWLTALCALPCLLFCCFLILFVFILSLSVVPCLLIQWHQ